MAIAPIPSNSLHFLHCSLALARPLLPSIPHQPALISEIPGLDLASSCPQAVTKANLGYDPVEVGAEDMVRMAAEQPQVGSLACSR